MELGYCLPALCDYSAYYRTLVDYRVKAKDRYHLVIVQCGGDKPILKADVQYTLLNPGGQQLPLGEIPLPDLYIVITCIWALLVGLFGFVWMKNRQYIVMLHGLLSAVGVLKLAVVIVALCYWHTFKSTGRDIVQLKYLQSFIYALSETAFFCSLLLISKGWRITRSNLPPSEIRTISVALVLLLSTLLFFSFYNDGYYFLSLMIMYFFMLPKIFTSITRNTRALHTHMLLARYANIELNTEPVLAKIKMFKALRTAVILYLGSILIISSMKIIMWWFVVWVTFCVSELVTIVMVVAVCYLTRPRENGVFSPRSYFEGGPFPILNMQQFDHFDELFGDQIWDPDMVFGNNAAALAAQSSHPQIDVANSLVIEYPVPSFPEKESGAPNPVTNYFPRLAIATLEKEKKEGGGGEGGNAGNAGERPNTLRRRAHQSSALASSTTSLLAPPTPSPESPSLLSSSSSSSYPLLLSPSPLLLSSSSSSSLPYEGLELDVLGEERGMERERERERGRGRSLSMTSTATQTSPPPTPIPFPPSSSSSSSSSTTTTTTTTTTASTPYKGSSTPPSTKDTERKDKKEKNKERKDKKEKNKDRGYGDGVTPTSPSSPSSSLPSPPSFLPSSASSPSIPCTITTQNTPVPISRTRSFSLSSPLYNSSSSLLEKSDFERGRRIEDEDDEDLL
eukprot:Phypoly_transcript_03824.p1 GENE.Phypoly_transcript_03824~~Phypoly_transcript_03824.p1  ORF type:complete len:766 (+),score=217.76 Phypoly_transcript_03824:263-2299(+)